jgi:uncharacterized protein (TIGR02271 family)
MALSSNMGTDAAAWAASDMGHNFTDEERTIPVYREEFRVGKREVDRGAVHVSVHVIERPVSEVVTLREEHVDVERRALDRVVQSDDSLFRDEEIEMSEIGEEVVAEKNARLVEEVIVHKHVDEHAETIGDRVRSTEVDVRTIEATSALGR